MPFLVFYFQFLLNNFNYFKHTYLIDFLLVFEVPGGIVLLCVLYLLILTHNGLIVPYIFILLDCEFIFSRVLSLESWQLRWRVCPSRVVLLLFCQVF